MNQRKPKADQRLKLAEASFQAADQMSAAHNNIGTLNYQISDSEGQLALSTGQAAAQLRNHIAQCQRNISQLSGNINTLQSKINSNAVQIAALNQQIHPYDVQLRRLWLDATEVRKKWIDFVNPMGKFTRGDFKELQEHIDVWTRLDTVWPGVYLWAALCAFEQGDQERADNYARLAGTAFQELYGPRKKWSQGEALAGLILSKSRGSSTKAEKLLANARRHANKESDWETYYFLGCAYANKKDNGRAKANFKSALEIAPSHVCLKAWNARIQIRSADAEDNIDNEIETLKTYWDASKETSWQLGLFLSEAYLKTNQPEEAKKVLVQALQLVPAEKQKSIKDDFEAFQKSLTGEKRKSTQKKSR
jgi:tetratricopeptide (TPR) repeat protein